jgi:hypothetical protein
MKNNIKNKYPIIWTHSYKTIGNSKVKILVLPPLDILNWLFRFDEETGKLYRMRGADGKDYNFEVKQLDSNKEYLRINIVDSYSKGAEFLVHRIIYKIKTGVDPDGFVDHIDQNKINNKFDNLRVVDNATNKRNSRMSRRNKTGITGVRQLPNGNYEPNIGINGRCIKLGVFHTVDEAVIARNAALQTANAFYGDVGFTELHGAAQ